MRTIDEFGLRFHILAFAQFKEISVVVKCC